MKFSDLPAGNKFCVFPWAGAFIQPTGKVMACCLQTHINDDRLHDFSIDEIRNSKEWIKLRKDLINGIEHPSCKKCWDLEKNNIDSLRTGLARDQIAQIIDSNGNITYDFTKFDKLKINRDGTLTSDDNVIYWDVRSSNLCNMKCVSCNPSFSSSINAELITEGDPVIQINNKIKDSILDKIKGNLNNITKFYFAGGEPLFNDMHWEILDILIDSKKYNIPLFYTTNLSKLSYKGRDIIDYWKKFKNLDIRASVDCVGKRAEYVRAGTNWNSINKNIQLLSSTFPNSFRITVTTSILSIGGLKELFTWANKHNIKISINNFVSSPTWLNVNILPIELRNKIWNDNYKELKNYENTGDKETDKWNKIDIKNFKKYFFDTISYDEMLKSQKSFKKNILSLDKIRKNNIISACPELAPFLKNIKNDSL